MAFTAKDVQALREMTGVGMMDCKKALTETDGDMDKAVEYLREKGLAAAQKKAGRIAAEGIAYAAVVDGVGVVVEVNAETDFVGKNDLFVDFVKGVAAAVVKNNPADVEALMAAPYGNGHTVQEELQEKVLVIGENIQIRRFALFADGVSVPYNHAGGKIGVLVNLEVSAGLEDKVTEVGKDLAMQIAALNPRFLDKSEVDQATLDTEKKIMLIQMSEDPKMASKPDKVKEGIVAGKMGKFFKENCLLQQEFVKDSALSVEEYVAKTAKELGGTIALKGAVRFEKGEGIEKKQEDFAAEIAKQLNK
ncbi:Elongation factor Ts [uncultured Eubacteriales bacterium]|uniref:Elongation factor Ts n=1 Tax=uncultured Eubacteriales bacterium TaxID=172733 RepID=A0A212K006_9FIRM|nr:Elongation factor Ts [uncultured Eubacteriales bacterium]